MRTKKLDELSAKFKGTIVFYVQTVLCLLLLFAGVLALDALTRQPAMRQKKPIPIAASGVRQLPSTDSAL